MLHIAQLTEVWIKWVRFDGMKEWGRKKNLNRPMQTSVKVKRGDVTGKACK